MKSLKIGFKKRKHKEINWKCTKHETNENWKGNKQTHADWQGGLKGGVSGSFQPSPVSRQHLSSRPLSNSDNSWTKLFPFLFVFSLFLVFFSFVFKKVLLLIQQWVFVCYLYRLLCETQLVVKKIDLNCTFDWLIEEDGAFRSIWENPYLSTESTSEFNGTFTF